MMKTLGDRKKYKERIMGAMIEFDKFMSEAKHER
jgi:hypothetical protein